MLKDSDVDFSLKYLDIGIEGQLGHDVVLELKEKSVKVIAPSRAEFDLTNKDQIKEYVVKEKPDVIMHCAAYTAVDNAEDEKDLCCAINVNGTKAIAEAAKMINSKIVYISTDYAFDD